MPSFKKAMKSWLKRKTFFYVVHFMSLTMQIKTHNQEYRFAAASGGRSTRKFASLCAALVARHWSSGWYDGVDFHFPYSTSF